MDLAAGGGCSWRAARLWRDPHCMPVQQVGYVMHVGETVLCTARFLQPHEPSCRSHTVTAWRLVHNRALNLSVVGIVAPKFVCNHLLCCVVCQLCSAVRQLAHF
jgi:hypothetical protein